jgi:hypothetical protein
MICFKNFKPQRSRRLRRGDYIKKLDVLCILCGEKIKSWPTNRLGHKE